MGSSLQPSAGAPDQHFGQTAQLEYLVCQHYDINVVLKQNLSKFLGHFKCDNDNEDFPPAPTSALPPGLNLDKSKF